MLTLLAFIAQKIPKIQQMSLSNNKNVALSARNIFGVAALAGRASSVRFPVSLKFHRAIGSISNPRTIPGLISFVIRLQKKDIASQVVWLDNMY